MRGRFGPDFGACLGLALALHGAVFAALNRTDTRTRQADTPPGALQVRMLAAVASPAPPSPPDEQAAEAVQPPAAKSTVAAETLETATDGPVNAQPLGAVQIGLPDVPLDATTLDLHAWLQFDEQGGVEAVDVSEQPDTLAPFVLAVRDGLSHARFETVAPRRSLCVSVVFADQQPVRVQSLGLANAQRCLAVAPAAATLSAATR